MRAFPPFGVWGARALRLNLGNISMGVAMVAKADRGRLKWCDTCNRLLNKKQCFWRLRTKPKKWDSTCKFCNTKLGKSELVPQPIPRKKPVVLYAWKSLGFASYSDYLKSDLWKGIRARVLKCANGRCCCCNAIAFEVHHDVYSEENLSGRSLNGLFAICRKCHQTIEFTESGRKRKRRVVRRLFRLAINGELGGK